MHKWHLERHRCLPQMQLLSFSVIDTQSHTWDTHSLMVQCTKIFITSNTSLIFNMFFLSHTQSHKHIFQTYTVTKNLLNRSKRSQTPTYNTSAHTDIFIQHTHLSLSYTHIYTLVPSPLTSCPWCQKHVICFLCQQVCIPDRKSLYGVSIASKLNMGDFHWPDKALLCNLHTVCQPQWQPVTPKNERTAGKPSRSFM